MNTEVSASIRPKSSHLQHLISIVSRILVEINWLLFICPLNIATVLPYPNLLGAVNLDESSSAMLLSVEPLSLINASILPLESARALTLVIDELTVILLAVGPL